MVEMASAKFVCIVDDTKLVDGLGGSGRAPYALSALPSSHAVPALQRPRRQGVLSLPLS